MPRASLLLLSLIVALPAAADVYQWRDAQGRINYSDTPPTQGTVQTLRKGPNAATLPPTTEETKPSTEAEVGKDKAAPAKPKTAAEQDLEFRQRRAAAAEAEAKAEKARQGDEERKLACENARGQLTALQSERRVARYNSSGERELVDGATRKAESERIQKFVDANCK